MRKYLVPIGVVIILLSILVAAFYTSQPNLVNHSYNVYFQNEGGNFTKFHSNINDNYINDIKENYNDASTSINSKFNYLIAIIGIVVAIWVGLNIYNIFSNEDLQVLKQELNGVKNESIKINSELENVKKISENLNIEIGKKLETLKNDVESISRDIYDSPANKQVSTEYFNTTNNLSSIFTRVHILLHLSSERELLDIASSDLRRGAFVERFYRIAQTNGLRILDHSVHFSLKVNVVLIFNTAISKEKLEEIFAPILSNYNYDVFTGSISKE